MEPWQKSLLLPTTHGSFGARRQRCLYGFLAEGEVQISEAEPSCWLAVPIPKPAIWLGILLRHRYRLKSTMQTKSDRRSRYRSHSRQNDNRKPDPTYIASRQRRCQQSISLNMIESEPQSTIILLDIPEVFSKIRTVFNLFQAVPYGPNITSIRDLTMQTRKAELVK